MAARPLGDLSVPLPRPNVSRFRGQQLSVEVDVRGRYRRRAVRFSPGAPFRDEARRRGASAQRFDNAVGER